MIRRPALSTLAVLLAFVSVPLLSGCGEAEAPGGTVPAAQADPAKGGQLYDKFWSVSTAPEPTTTHPLWSARPDPEANTRTGSTTWRCKECHGWDYKGVEGAYAKGSHRTGFPGIFGSTLDREAILTSLAEKHGYRAAGRSEAHLEALADFVQKDLVDTATLIDGQGAFRGDATRGKALYAAGLGGNKSCTTCHGGTGLKAPKGAPEDYEAFVGAVANENPWEFLHKVRFGHPGSKMPAAVRGTATTKDVADLGAFAQTLPKTK
jgi:mono/diheme cytochrome c family protein